MAQNLLKRAIYGSFGQNSAYLLYQNNMQHVVL